MQVLIVISTNEYLKIHCGLFNDFSKKKEINKL